MWHVNHVINVMSARSWHYPFLTGYLLLLLKVSEKKMRWIFGLQPVVLREYLYFTADSISPCRTLYCHGLTASSTQVSSFKVNSGILLLCCRLKTLCYLQGKRDVWWLLELLVIWQYSYFTLSSLRTPERSLASHSTETQENLRERLLLPSILQRPENKTLQSIREEAKQACKNHVHSLRFKFISCSASLLWIKKVHSPQCFLW